MPSNTYNDRNRAYLASVLRLLMGSVVLLVSFHADPVSAISPVVVSIAAPSEDAAVDAGASTEAELPMCDLTDISLAVAPGSCPVATPEVVARAAQEEGAKAPADKPLADRAPADKAAPMCASDATSIAAPVEIPEVDRGHFEPLPCNAQALLLLLRSHVREGGNQLVAARHRAPLQSPSLNDGSGAFSVPLYWPERAAPITLASHLRGALTWQPGHRSRIDRPPSLRA